MKVRPSNIHHFPRISDETHLSPDLLASVVQIWSCKSNVANGSQSSCKKINVVTEQLYRNLDVDLSIRWGKKNAQDSIYDYSSSPFVYLSTEAQSIDFQYYPYCVLYSTNTLSHCVMCKFRQGIVVLNPTSSQALIGNDDRNI